MSNRQRIIKQDKIDINLQLSHFWQNITAYVPSILKNPLEIITLILRISNFALQITLYLVLIAQTAHVLNNNEKRYINLRHLLIKWMSLIIMLSIQQHIKKHTSHAQLFSIFINTLTLLMIYPSKFIKSLHLKYFSFSERKKYDQSEQDPSNYQISITTRVLVSITLFFLNSSRFIITFVPLHHRKKIEESMKGVNMVIVQQKYFWKMYESTWSNPNPNPQQANPITSNNNIKLVNKNESSKDIKTAIQSRTSSRQNILRWKATELFLISGIKQKFSNFRDIELIYNIQTSQLTLTNLLDNKSTDHVLREIIVIEDALVQLNCQDEDEPIYVRFKGKKDVEVLVSAIGADDNDL